MKHDQSYFDLTTPRQFTARGGWNVVCECGVVIGETGDDDLEERLQRHAEQTDELRQIQ